MSILALLPGGDPAADTAAAWGRNALAQVPHTPLVDVQATEPAIRQAASPVVLYFGHGTPDAWMVGLRPAGGFQRTLLHAKAADALSGAAALALACHSSRGLGPEAIRLGARAFVGFRDRISWMPHIAASVAAVDGCVTDLVAAFLATPLPPGAALRRTLAQVIDSHRSYWADLRDRGDPGASEAFAAVDRLQTFVEVL